MYLFDPSGASTVTGNINFTKTSQGVHVQGEIRGLTPGLHGFHIHKLGNIFPTCVATSGHFNPYNVSNYN